MKREEKAKEKNVNSPDRKRLKHGETTEKERVSALVKAEFSTELFKSLLV